MTFNLPPARRLRDPRLRELLALSDATGATMRAAEPPASGGEGGGESGSSSQEGAGGAGEEHGQEGSGEAGESGEGSGKPSWDDFVAALPEDQQDMVRGEIERREKETRKARNEARNLRTRAQDAEAKAAGVDEAHEAKKTAEQQASEATTVVRQENQGLRRRLVTQQIRVQAAASFADPDDPAELLAGQVEDFMDNDLEPDTEAISDALKDLLERKPHLAKQDAKPRPPAPTKAQGSSGSQTSAPGSKGAAEAARRYGLQKQAAS